MSAARCEYFRDLLKDAVNAAEEGLEGLDISDDTMCQLISAVIIADSINGLRKALLSGRGLINSQLDVE